MTSKNVRVPPERLPLKVSLYCSTSYHRTASVLDIFLNFNYHQSGVGENAFSIAWQEHRTNDSILTELGLERELMGRVAKLKLQYFGHITRGSAGQLALAVLEGIMEGLRHQGRPRRQWIQDIEEWAGCKYTQLKEMSQDRTQWRRDIGVVVCCRQPSSRKVD